MNMDFDAVETDQDEGHGGIDLRDALAAAMDDGASNEGLPRDEKGRFASREQGSEQPEANAAAAVETPEGQEPAPKVEADGGTEDAKSEDPTTRAPQFWPEAEKALFAELPPDVQKIILDRESQRDAAFTRKTQEFSSRIKLAEDLENVIGPRRQQLSMQGMSEAQAVQQLFALSDFAASDPVNFIRQFSQARGIDLSQLVQPTSSLDDEYVDPQIKTLNDKISELQGQLQQRQQYEQGLQHQTIQQEITSFASATDEKGQPLRPYYDLVQQEMVGFVATLRQQHPTASNSEILDRAYKAAVAVNPRVQELSQAQEALRRQQQAQAKAGNAKRAAVSPRSTPYGAPGGGNAANDLRSMIEASFEG